MAEIVASFLGPAIEVVKWVATPIVRQFNYLCCFTNNITSLKDEAEKLDNAARGLQEQVDRETENVRVIVPAVESWLKDSNDLKSKKETILGKVPNVESGCLKLRARFSLSKEAKKTTDRMKELRGQKNFDAISQPGPPAATKAIPLGKTCEFESRKEIEEDIMTTLRGGDVNVMGIYGMGGLGKTTMAKKIMNRVLEEHVFQEAVMAVVSQQVDESKIQIEIGGSLNLHLQDDTRQVRVQKLHARLTGTKRILLVLDDVWEGIELEGLGIPCDSKGCTILFTSRNIDALSAMSVQKKFGMKVLSEEDAWFLFRKRAGTCVDDSKLNSIAKEVVKECSGLPIALTTVGAALKGKKDVRMWKDALKRLKQSDQDIRVYNPLKLSYDFLSSDQEKCVFLLCCLFAEDALIPLEQLTYFCVGLGIFESTLNLEGARNRMCTLADTLKSRSLLLDDIYNNEDYVRMHDIVRDVCISIAKQEAYIGGSDCSWFSSQLLGERNEFCATSGFPNLRLLFFNHYKMDGRFSKFDDAFLEGVRDLSVLCIENYSLTSVPSQESMKNLKTLILDDCEGLKTISVVGELVNLEILRCRNCNSIEVLPPEIKGLNRLKLLELTGCENLQSIGRGIISSLVGLEELKMLESFDQWEAEDREERVNAGLRELEALTNLTCLEIEIQDPALAAEDMRLSSKMERFDIRIGTNYEFGSYYKKLSLQFEGETRLGHWIEMQLLRDSECLDLRGNGAHNVELAKSQKLRWLELYECKTMKNVVRTSNGATATHEVFSSIEYLDLRSLPQLEEICDGPISSTSFQNLSRIYINDCPHLHNLDHLSIHAFHNLSRIYINDCPRLRNLGHLSIHAGEDCLSHLEELCIENCDMMEQVFLWNTNNSHIPQVFPKLKKIELEGLPNLATLCQGIQGIEFPLLTTMNLSSITIGHCPRLRNLGQLSIHVGEDCLSHLEEIHISNCDMMEQVFLWNTNNSHITQVSPKLKKIALGRLTTIFIEECPKWTSIVSTDHHLIGSTSNADTNDSLHLFCQSHNVSFGNLKEVTIDRFSFCGHEIPISSFNGLEKLRISRYHGSTILFSSSIARNLVNLIYLTIKDCDEVVQVINDDEEEEKENMVSGGKRTVVVFPKLEELQLRSLPKLVTFCEWKSCDVELPSLRKVEIWECPDMKNWSLGLLAAPNLEVFQTDLNNDLEGVGVNVSFDRLKDLSIQRNKYPFYYHHKIFISLVSGLEKLHISSCQSSFPSSMAANLVSLRELLIWDCDEIVKVIEDEEEKVVSGGERTLLLFPKLVLLHLWGLPKLVRFCEWKCQVEMPSLESVHIQHCPNMEHFSLGPLTTPNLKIIQIDYKDVGAENDLNGALQQRLGSYKGDR